MLAKPFCMKVASPSGRAHTLQFPTSLTSITCKASDSIEFHKKGTKRIIVHFSFEIIQGEST